MSIALIGGGMALATEVFKFLGAKESQKYINEMVRHKKALSKELEKPVDQQDDSKIETIGERIAIIEDMAMAQLRAYREKK